MTLIYWDSKGNSLQVHDRIINKVIDDVNCRSMPVRSLGIAVTETYREQLSQTDTSNQC